MGWIKRIVGGSSRGRDPGDAEKTPPTTQRSAAAAVIEKWDRAIAKVQARLDAVLNEALEASEPLIAATQADMGPLTRLWSAVEAKKHRHSDKIASKWDSISDELSELDELPAAIMDQEGDKRDLAHCEIDVRYHRAYRDVMARAAANMQRWAATSGDPAARCLFVGSGALCLGQQAAFDAWEAMTRAETRMGQYRKSRAVPMSLLEQYEAAATEYWTTLLNVEAQHVPEIAQHVPLKLQGYLKTVNRTLRQYWQWRERHG